MEFKHNEKYVVSEKHRNFPRRVGFFLAELCDERVLLTDRTTGRSSPVQGEYFIVGKDDIRLENTPPHPKPVAPVTSFGWVDDCAPDSDFCF